MSLPSASAVRGPEGLVVHLSGSWRLTDRDRPSWRALVAGPRPPRIIIDGAVVGSWDSSLAAFLMEAAEWCEAAGVPVSFRGLAKPLEDVVLRRRAIVALAPVEARSDIPFRRARLARLRDSARMAAEFLGNCVLGVGAVLSRRTRLRVSDAVLHAQQAGAEGLPIIGLVALLVGAILAFQAELQLRRFGAEAALPILIDLSVAREMGPIIVAIVLSGRTAAAYAAELGSMAAQEELDALEVVGISPITFLVVPRLLALAAMAPLLTLYANALAMTGGAAVAAVMARISPLAYLIATRRALSWSDLRMGLIKGAAFGVLIGLCGCLRGLYARRDAAGVGRAATSAVVASILSFVTADAVFGKLFSLWAP